MKQTLVILILVALAAAVGGTAVFAQQYVKRNLPTSAKINLHFTTQAPYGNWAEPWQNACEETSVIMVDTFYKGDTLSKEKAKQEILRVFNLKTKQFGASKDESMDRVADLINSADLVWKAKVVVAPTLDDIKNELAEQRPVIIPVDARKLTSNPRYEVSTVKYHVFILSGYDDEKQQFIAQDPGISRGANFRYGYDEIMNAISDYLIQQGQQANLTDASTRKAVIFTEKR